MSMSVMMGALIFGIGMQLGGGCASGTLYTCCAGKARIWVTLFFCLGLRVTAVVGGLTLG